jgi:PAS domain S-box-containing protein
MVNPAQYLELVAANSSDLVAVLDQNWTYKYVSPASKTILGYEPKELIGKSALDLVFPQDLKELTDKSQKSISKDKTLTTTYRVLNKSGAYVWIETVFKKAINEGEIIAVSSDITAKKSSEQMVKKFVEAVECTSDCVVMADTDGRIIYANPAIAEVSGYTKEEMIGYHADFIWGGMLPADEIAKMWKSLKETKKSYSVEVPNVKKDGENYITEVHISPVLDQDKNISFFVGISRDVTKAKEVERVKNEFISLASHQLRTPLAAVKWRLEMLMDKPLATLPKQVQQNIVDINTSNERMIDLVNTLLNISRVESGRLIIDPRMVSLEEVMLSVLEDLKPKMDEKHLKVKLSFQTNIYDISVDPKLITTVFYNVVNNAAKYTPENGQISVSMALQGNEVITKVSDTGYGIPKNEQHRIFDKFFRAENVKKIDTDGTGIGLFLVKTILDAMEGKIWFESSEGKGTTFWISISTKGTVPRKGDVSLS